jgi:hypothetical protein
MVLSKTVDTARQLAEFLRGTEIARGTAGAGDVATTTFSDVTVGAFADVEAGQTIYIAAEGTFLVASVTDDNEIELDSALSQTLAAAHWRVCSGPISAEDTRYAGPDSGQNGKWIAIWDSATFHNA